MMHSQSEAFPFVYVCVLRAHRLCRGPSLAFSSLWAECLVCTRPAVGTAGGSNDKRQGRRHRVELREA